MGFGIKRWFLAGVMNSIFFSLSVSLIRWKRKINIVENILFMSSKWIDFMKKKDEKKE